MEEDNEIFPADEVLSSEIQGIIKTDLEKAPQALLDYINSVIKKSGTDAIHIDDLGFATYEHMGGLIHIYKRSFPDGYVSFGASIFGAIGSDHPHTTSVSFEGFINEAETGQEIIVTENLFNYSRHLGRG